MLALAGALASITATPEGRFYGLMGNATFGPLGGITGSASGRFHTMLVEDLDLAREQGLLAAQTPVNDLAVLVSGALREIGATAAREPKRAPQLLAALRGTCAALLHQ